MSIFSWNNDFESEETVKKKNCPCCSCDIHWMACRFCEHYDTDIHRNHERHHEL